MNNYVLNYVYCMNCFYLLIFSELFVPSFWCPEICMSFGKFYGEIFGILKPNEVVLSRFGDFFFFLCLVTIAEEVLKHSQPLCSNYVV